MAVVALDADFIEVGEVVGALGRDIDPGMMSRRISGMSKNGRSRDARLLCSLFGTWRRTSARNDDRVLLLCRRVKRLHQECDRCVQWQLPESLSQIGKRKGRSSYSVDRENDSRRAGDPGNWEQWFEISGTPRNRSSRCISEPKTSRQACHVHRGAAVVGFVTIEDGKGSSGCAHRRRARRGASPRRGKPLWRRSDPTARAR